MVDIETLDPGIREVVRRLIEAGFVTVDSGDGESKPYDEREFDYPHVFMRIPRSLIVQESRRLLTWAEEHLLPGFAIEATYSPVDNVALLCLYDATHV